MKYETLKKLHRDERESFSEDFNIRIHRALSWLEKAEKEHEDADSSFIFYWISFNASYTEMRTEVNLSSERIVIKSFLKKLIELDKEEIIYQALWTQFTKSIRLLLNNQYIFEPFWKFQNGDKMYSNWKTRFDDSKIVVNRSLQFKDTPTILEILFDRLYTLRNQMLHGGATWNSNVNRDQVTNGQQFLSFIIPEFLNIMMKNHKKDWGTLSYPLT